MDKQIPVGCRFGRFVVISTTKKYGLKYAKCVCDCGTKKDAKVSHLTSGLIVSCGCYRKERSTKHGKSSSKVYHAWGNMIARCNRIAHPEYRHYGGRGIRVCKRWLKFENFYADMGDSPLSLDRRNNDGNYEPSNCHWVSQKEQCSNRRGNRFLTVGPRRMTATQWATELGVPLSTIRWRLRKGWPVEKALTFGDSLGKC